MEIIKELNLNGNPQTAKNGSLVYAENIRLSSDGTFLTNDEGFKSGIITSYGNPKVLPNLKIENVEVPVLVQSIYGSIVGNINCPNEIVIITNFGKIYRLIECKNYDELCVVDTGVNITYNNGKINGTYIYNVEGDLIVAIGEYDGSKKSPLKVINLNKENDFYNESFYTTSPDIPVANLKFNGYKNGNIPCGLYYFFIRYKHNNIYTSWFPIGKSYQAVSQDYKRLIHHTYNIGDDNPKGTTNTSIYSNINKEINCNYTFDFDILLNNNSYGYSHIQLGYIIQSNNGIFARINEEFKISTSDNVVDIPFIFNNLNSKETSIDSIIKPVFRINNVKALTSFNNKLYIGNYDELDNIDNEYTKINNNLINNPIQNSIVVESIHWSNDDNVSTLLKAKVKIQGYDDDNKSNDVIFKNDIEIVLNSDYKFFINTQDNTQDNYVDSLKIVDHLLSKTNLSGTARTKLPKYNNGDITTDYTTYVKYLNGIILDFSNEGYVGITHPNDIVGEVTYKIKPSRISNYYDLEVNPTVSFENYININQSDISGIITSSPFTENLKYDFTKEVKTLLPYEHYKFYIHYIRKDGSYTDGIEIADVNNITIPVSTAHYIPRFSIKFDGITNPNNLYIGCFITYAKLKPSFNVYIEKVNGNIIYAKSNDYQLNLINVQNAKLTSLFKFDRVNGIITYLPGFLPETYNIVSIKSVLSNATSNISAVQINRKNIEGVIAIELESAPSDATHLEGFVCSIYPNTSLNDENIQLHSLGYNYNFSGNYEEGNGIVFDLPGYLVYDKFINYIKHIYTKENNKIWNINTVDFDNNGNLLNEVYANLLLYPKYSNFYLNALSIKKEPETIQSVYANSRTIENTIIEAQNLSDLFQFKNDYIINVYKSYIKYDENRVYVDKFTNGIRNSYPIRTESVEVNWRVFDAENYYLIDKDLGEITNLLGVNKYLYIHTNKSLLIASSDATITANNTNISLNQHKLFDVAPTELFTSDLGYGGLKYQNAQIFSINGYIWYDTDHNKLFRYDNSKIEDLTSYIQEYVDKYKFEFCYFNLDNKTNRIFISFTNDNLNYYTFGYSTLVNKFISKLNFKFNKNIHTTNNSYFTVGNAPLKYSDTDFGNYKSLSTISLSGKIKSIFDIIINIGPETPKELESIRWIHKYINPDIIDTNNYAELKEDNVLKTINSLFKNPENIEDNLENVYIRIFNNNVDSGELPLFNSKLNSIEHINTGNQQNIQSYKYPHYEKGVWQFNYFRDGILIDLTETDINSIVDENEKNKWLKLAQAFEEKIIDGVKHYYRLSDVQSLIYGTYFVIRFIFENKKSVIEGAEVYFNKRFKFDSISTKINNY